MTGGSLLASSSSSPSAETSRAYKVSASAKPLHVVVYVVCNLEFPSEPTGILRRHIADEADLRMACYLPLPDNSESAPNPEDPPRPQLPEGAVDAPLVRLFNFLRK
jgi:hypothetical protein